MEETKMASEYDRKFEEMKNYIPFLESMIKRLENSSGSTNPRQAQLDKIRSLRDLLLDKKKRMKMENLLKCEQVLVNLYAKVEQRDTLPGIDLKVPSPAIKVKEEPDLDVVRNKLKIVTKMQEELPDTLPEIARANENQDTSTAGAKEPALFQRRPNMMGSSISPLTQPADSRSSLQKRNYTRVLVSPESSPQRWSKQDNKIIEKPLYSRRSPRRQSPTHKKDRKQTKQSDSSNSNLNITLKVPEESLDSLNTSDIFSRIINCSDNDVDIATLRELRSQILGELKHTGAKDDISDLILNSTKKKKKKKSHKQKEDIEEGELSDSESEAIENIYGSLVILDKDQNTPGQSKLSNKQEQKPRKIQIRLVINSENEAVSSDSPSSSDKKGLVSDLSDVSELEMFDPNKDLESKVNKALVSKLHDKSDVKVDMFDDDIAPKASELPNDESPQVIEPSPKKVGSVNTDTKESDLLEVDKNTEDKKTIDKNTNDDMPFKPNFYNPLTDNDTDNKESKAATDTISKENKNMSNDKESGMSSDEKNSSDKNITSVSDVKNDVPKKESADIEIPLLNEPSVASHKPKESVVSEIDILQALKNEILSDTIAIPVTDQVTPALHQPKLTKVANTQEIASKKRISIEKYKQKSKPKPAAKPLFTSHASMKDDLNKKQSLKLTEKEYERFKFALDNELSSDDDDIYEDLNKSDEDDAADFAPKSPDNDESSNIGTNNPVIIPVDPVKNIIACSKADVDMRTLIPILSPVAAATTLATDNKESVIESKQSLAKVELNRPSDPRLKRDSTLNIRNDSLKPVPPTILSYPNINTSVPAGNMSNLIPPVPPNLNMTSSITPNIVPNMTPTWAPNMTPIMTPNSRSYEIDDQPKRNHVYASLPDPGDYAEDTQRPHWEKTEKTTPYWEPNDERERNQDRPPKYNQEAKTYNRYNDTRGFYNRDDNSVGRLDSQIPMYRRIDAPMTPSHPFGRSDCPPTPTHSFGRSDCPPTPSHIFGRSECPPTPIHSFGRSECPSTPSHPFGRSECPPTPSHPFGRLDCPATPNHHFGRSESSTHSFGRSECPLTPSHPFGRSECPPTPSHPFGHIDPRLKKNNESNLHNDDRNRRYLNDQSSYKTSQPYNPIHDLNNKAYNNIDNYRNREQSVGRNDRNRPNYYNEQNNRNNNEERKSRRESNANYDRSRNYDHEEYNGRGRRSENDYNHNDKHTKFESRSHYQREKSVGQTNPINDRQVRSNSRARSVGRNPEREDENDLSVKSNPGRSFTIDTSVNSTFQNFIKNNKEKSIFDQLFDRNNRASSVGRTFVRETSVGRTLTRPLNLNDNAENTNDRFRRARSVVKDTKESKSFSEIKADFESFRSKANVVSNKRHDSINSKAVDRNSPRSPIIIENNYRKNNDSKLPYSPRKNNRDPRLNRDSYARSKQKEDKYRYDARDKKKYGIIYSNDNIASGAILGSGYGVKNYKIPKIKRAEEVPPITPTKEKTNQIKEQNKLDNSTVKLGKFKSDENNKNKEKEIKSGEQGNKRIDNVKSNDDKVKNSNKKVDNDEPKIVNDHVIGRPRRNRRQIKESEDSDDTSNQDSKSPKVPQKTLSEKKVVRHKDQEDNSLDNSFGIDDENAVSDPVTDRIDSLIANLDDDIETSKIVTGNKSVKDISIESTLESITSQSENQVPIDVSIDSALQEINKLIGNSESKNYNNSTKEMYSVNTLENEETQSKHLKDIKMLDDVKNSNLETQFKEKEEMQTANKDAKVPLDEKSISTEKEIMSNDKTQTEVVEIAKVSEKLKSIDNEIDETTSKSFKESDAIVSTTEHFKDKINGDQSQNDESTVRSSTPDSTNTDDIPKESIPSDTLPDSTDEVHTEVSEVSSSNNSAQLSKEPEPNSSNKEVAATSGPLGNILSILQSKSKLKELLSMLGDQSSENDKIKKKLEKLSEIVSDEEDTRDDVEQVSTIGVDQESRDGTEIECVENNKESKDDTQQDMSKGSLETTEDENILSVKDSTKTEAKVEFNESLDNNSEQNTVKINKALKKIPIKKVKMTKKRNAKPSKKISVDEKCVTRSVITQQKNLTAKKKVSRELLKLQEDIKEMFISDDVLNVTGIRMCRLAKLVDENSQKDNSSKSDTEPVVVLEKINNSESNEVESKVSKIKSLTKKKLGPKSKVHAEGTGDANDKPEKSKSIAKYKPGPKSKTKSRKTPVDVDPYDFETDSINESNASKISEGSIRDSSDSDSESLTSLTSFGSSETLSELKPLSELKRKPKRKRCSWQTGVIKTKNKKKKIEQKVEPKSQNTDYTKHIQIPDFNCFIDKEYCYIKNVFTYSCRLCVYSGEEIVAHYKKEHPHTEIPLSRLSPEVAKEAIEQCEGINFHAISRIPTDKYICRFCCKEFGKKKAALESFFWHVVSMHTGEYKQICSECVNITRCPFNLDIPPPPKDTKGQLIGYICGKCNFTQISLENLKTHVIVRHNDEQTEVYTINLAVMSRKIVNLLSKRVSLPEIEQPRVLRSSRSNQSMAEMSDDRSDATESNSIVTEPETKEIEEIERKDKRKSSIETKSKLKSKITFENDDSASASDNNSINQTPVKIEKEDLEEEITNNSNERIRENQKCSAISEVFALSHFKVNYIETGTGLELMCFVNDIECHYKCSSMKAFRTHVTVKHRDLRWNGYCIDCKDFVNSQGKYAFKDCLTHFHEKHMDKSRFLESIVSDVHFKINLSESGIKLFVCSIDGQDHYQCSSLMALKSQVSTHKGRWTGYCMDCKDFVEPRGEYLITDCLAHYMTDHNICDTSVPALNKSGIANDGQIPETSAPNDIFAYPHFKVTYTETGNKEFVCCINQKKGVHYKTPLLISLKRHVQTKHPENWDGYCFVCKVIVTTQGLHMFKDCLQHFLDKHMDDFPVLEKEPEPEKPVEEPAPAPAPRTYINVRPLSQLKSIDAEEAGLVLPKIESVVSLGAPAPATDFSSPPEEEVNEPVPPEPEPQPESDDFHNYEASQIKVMSQKHPVVQEAMLRKEKLVRVFKCAGSYCSFTTDSADMALSHALTHQKIGGENALCCSYCDFDCSGNAIDLVVHVFKHASCPFSCGYCFYRAAAAQLVVAHSNIAHSGKQVKVYIATNATLPKKDTAKMLTREAVVQYYVCNYEFGSCKFKTYTARKFCDHLNSRHTGEHSCYICSQSLPTATDLVQHMKTHDLNLYQCTWCMHGADTEAELLTHAASTHPTHQPQAFLRIITNKDGSSEMRVLPLASFNRSSIGVEHVVTSTHPENPVKEAERSIDLQKLIGQTKLMFETIASTSDQPLEVPLKTNEDMATLTQTNIPAEKTPPRTASPQSELSEQTTPILKTEPAEVTPSKTSDEIVCLDSDEETSEDRSETTTSVIDISTDGDDEPTKSGRLIDYQVFKCPKCLHCCKTDTGLKLHILKCYNPNWPMACPHCHKMTENREALVQHYITDHCKKYVCSYCNREMHTLKGAKTHMKVIHKITKVNVVYGTGKNNHMVEKDNSGATRVAPKRKLSMTTAPVPPVKQMKRYGPQDVDQLPINPILDDLVYCSLCEFNTKVRLNMVRHLQQHGEQQPVPQTAPVNPVPHLETNEMHFDKMVNLASSSLVKEKTKEVGPIVSQIPPEAAARYPKYVPERQRYTCGAKDCSYTSVDEAMLRCHWDTLHSGTTEYRCVHCPPYQHLDKSKPLIAARIMLHLKMHDTSLYACSSCTYYYFKKQVVEKHINDTHKGNGYVMVVREEATGPVVPPAAANAPTMDLKPWQCGLCKFKSMLRPEVAEHCAKHHQSKMQYKCAYCPFRTSTLENVVKHQSNSHPGRVEDIFYYYYREGSVADEDGTFKWVKQRQKMGITEDAVVKTESDKVDASASVAPPVAVDLNIVKKEVEDRRPSGEVSVVELCRKFGQFCEPNGLRYKCCLCDNVTEDNREAMQSHLYEELQYRKWRCSICSYKAFHKNGLHDHISTEHRGRMQEPLPINLPVDHNIERWVAELLQHQTTIIERNKQNLLIQKVQTPGPSGLNAPQKLPAKPIEAPIRNDLTPKELEDAFGPFGVPNNKEYSCPKCVFRTEKEESMKEHLESELTKIRWCCSVCAACFQTYHEALTHCKSKHDGQSARPKEALRDPHTRAEWVATCLKTQELHIPIRKETTKSNPEAQNKITGQKVIGIGKYNPKELEDAFGQFGVANNNQFCCPKCIFRTKSEDDMREHLEGELSRIRWSCSICPEKFQNYHEAQFHCKTHEGRSARPAEAPREPALRAAWLAAATSAQRRACPGGSPAPDPEDSLLVVRYEEKVPIPEPSTSKKTESSAKETSASPESDDEKLVIDEECEPKRIGNVTVCPHCPFQSKQRLVVKDHLYRHFGLSPYGCGYCDFSGYRSSVALHLEAVHAQMPKKIKVTTLPKGKPILLDLKNRRARRKNTTNEWRFCLVCQVTFTVEIAASHSHGDSPAVFVKHGDIVMNCKLCQTFRKDTALMEEHFASVHPDKPVTYFIYQILYHSTSSKSMLPAFKRIKQLPLETIDINDDEAPPPKKVARKSTTKLPMQAVAKKSTTKLPFLYVPEDEEYSFYGTKPAPLDSYENVTTLMEFYNTIVPFSVKKVSEILKINPRVVVKDYKK